MVGRAGALVLGLAFIAAAASAVHALGTPAQEPLWAYGFDKGLVSGRSPFDAGCHRARTQGAGQWQRMRFMPSPQRPRPLRERAAGGAAVRVHRASASGLQARTSTQCGLAQGKHADDDPARVDDER
jgi:hypothetical protein